MDHIFKVIFALTVAASAALASFALYRLFSVRLSGWFDIQRQRIASAADLAGIDIAKRTANALACAGPAACLVLRIVRRRRLVKADAQLPDALALLGNALKAGLALVQAIEMAAVELAPPLGPELAMVVAQLKLGRTVEEALVLFAERLPTDDVALVVQSIEVLRRTGGNLVETFNTLAQTVEGRLRVENRIRVLTAQGVYQGIMLLAMPWALGAALYLIAPDYIEPLFTTRLGLVFAAIGVMLEAVGALWLKRIVMIRA